MTVGIALEVDDRIKIAQRTALLEDEVRLVQTADIEAVLRDELSGFGMAVVVHQFENPVLVGAEREIRTPRELAPFVAVAQRQLDTPVAHRSGLNVERRITGRHGDLRVEGLVVGLRVVIRYVEVEMLQETHGKTHLPRIRAFGLQVVEGVIGLRLPHFVVGIPDIDGVGQETGEGHTYRGPRTAHLDVGEVLRHVGDELRKHHRGADGRVEERSLDRLRTGQLRRPVVAPRKGEVVGSLVPDFGRGEERLVLFAPAGLLACHTGVVELEDVEQIGDTRLHDGTAVLEGILPDIRNHGAHVGLQRPIRSEGLVDIEQHVAVGLLIFGLGDAVKSVVRPLDERRIGRGIKLLGEVVHRIVDSDTARNRKPVENPVGDVGIEHIAPAVVLAQVAVVDPVGILHRQIARTDPLVPVLHPDAAFGVVSFEHPHTVPVVSAGKQVSRNQRIGIRALIDHVAVVLHDVGGSDVQSHAVFEQRGGVAGREVVTLVAVVGHNTA